MEAWIPDSGAEVEAVEAGVALLGKMAGDFAAVTAGDLLKASLETELEGRMGVWRLTDSGLLPSVAVFGRRKLATGTGVCATSFTAFAAREGVVFDLIVLPGAGIGVTFGAAGDSAETIGWEAAVG